MVAVEPLPGSEKRKREETFRGQNLHSGKGNNTRDDELHALLHLKVLDNENWQYCKAPIRKSIEPRNHECEDHNERCTQALSLMSRIQIPPI